jgi:hypothetical protein
MDGYALGSHFVEFGFDDDIQRRDDQTDSANGAILSVFEVHESSSSWEYSGETSFNLQR